ELHLALDAGGPPTPRSAQCLPDVLDRFEFGRVKVRKASVEVKAGGVRVEVPHAGVAIKGKGGQLSVRVATRGGKVELPGRTVGLISTRTAANVDLRGAGAIELSKADVIGTEGSAFVKGKLQNLCNPDLEMAANVRVDDLATATERLLPGVLRGVKGGLSADATVSLASGKPRARGDLRLKALAIEGFYPGDARLRFDATPAKVKVDRLDIPTGKGAINGSVELDLDDAELPLSGELSLREMDLAELLHKLGVRDAPVTLRASGKATVAGTLSPLHLVAQPGFELADFAVVHKKARMFEFSRGKLGAEVTIEPPAVSVRHAVIEAGATKVSVEGSFFTDVKKGMELVATSDGLDLDDFKGHIGPLPAHGRAAVGAHVFGPYRDLRVDGVANLSDFRFLELSLGDVQSTVSFAFRPPMQLTLDGIRGRKDRSSYTGRISLALGDPDVPVEAHLDLPDAYLHDMVELAVGLVPTLSTVERQEDVDGHFSGVLDVHGPVTHPDGTARLALDGVSLWQEQFAKGSAGFVLHGDNPRLEISQLTLEHAGGAQVKMAGNFGPDWKLDMDARSEGFTLADLDMMEPAKLTGPMRATVHVGGEAQHPLIGVKVLFDKGLAGKLRLGDGDLSLDVDGKVMTWRGTIGTHKLAGRASLLGEFPYTMTASLRIPDLDELVELAAPDLDVQSGSLAAEVELHGSLLAWRKSAGTVTLSQLKLVKSDMAFENVAPAQIAFGPEGLRVDRLALRAPYTTAQLSGSRNADGRLDLKLSASIDGRIVPGLMPDVEHSAGTFLIQASVGGTMKSPTVLGNLRIEDASVSLRGLPVVARSLEGSISFSQDALVIDSLKGMLNNGEARMSGGMELAGLLPKRIDMQAHISEVNVRLQESLGATFDGDLTLLGPPAEPVLGGSLIVSRMKYSEDLDIERSLLDFSRRPPQPKVLTKSAVLVHFDLDVHLSRGVRVENNLARTDLKGDLKVTGTSRALGLLGSVNCLSHGTAYFRGNEFQIEQGVVNFTDRQRIRPSFDFQATSQVKEYKVRLHAFGTPGEPHLTLASDPALAEADLGFLLTFGFVSQNLQQSTFSAADSGLAIGIEALNKATGFSEEVRRFIPKNAILRDPNIDFASEFSVATNRLEPMARFQSHLVSDKIDLKVLEGLTTRTYRGVLSYQLSDSLSTRLQLDNEHVYNGSGVDTDFGADIYWRWEGE
ncbi:MAG TPA: translocation/assembly module TamB domain-containing protein, partial [Myxococcales bacterium]|nr:translocation/assembly module TamB domain-containing protein [Myxococcales bacterium]